MILALFHSFLVGINVAIGVLNLSKGRSIGALNLGAAAFIAFLGLIVMDSRR